MKDIQKHDIPYEYQIYLELIFVDVQDFRTHITSKPTNNNLTHNFKSTKIYRFLHQANQATKRDIFYFISQYNRYKNSRKKDGQKTHHIPPRKHQQESHHNSAVNQTSLSSSSSKRLGVINFVGKQIVGDQIQAFQSPQIPQVQKSQKEPKSHATQNNFSEIINDPKFDSLSHQIYIYDNKNSKKSVNQSFDFFQSKSQKHTQIISPKQDPNKSLSTKEKKNGQFLPYPLQLFSQNPKLQDLQIDQQKKNYLNINSIGIKQQTGNNKSNSAYQQFKIFT